ncbi:MAG: NAD(P)-binding protein [Bacillota bacterium]|nr:NAD(P)-binding protein [Bacillota bacterium]
MMNLYPVTLRLAGKKVLVVGGGNVAERKVTGLLGTEANIILISPEVTEGLRNLANEGQIQWHQRKFSDDDLADAFLIFAATNRYEVNQSIKDTAGTNQLVTIADDPEGSDFHVPAKVQRGRLSITVSTGGASPTLARKISQQLEQEYDEQYEEYVEFLHWARQFILNEVEDPSVKKQLLNTIVNQEFLKSKNRKADFLKIYHNPR